MSINIVEVSWKAKLKAVEHMIGCRLLITGWPRPTTVESVTGTTLETRDERQVKREVPWRTFMLARPEVLVACRGFCDAEDNRYLPGYEDGATWADDVVQLHFGAGDHWVGQSPL